MATPFTNVHGSATISTSEYYLFSASTSLTSQTTSAKISGWIDFVNMTAAETYDVKVYEKVNAGTAKLAFTNRLIGVQSELYWVPEFWAVEGYEISVTKVAGTDRSILWSLNRDVGDTNLVTWLGSAPDALSSGKVPGDLKLWLAVAPTALTSGAVTTDVVRWRGSTPAVLGGGSNVPTDVLYWNGVAMANSLSHLGIIKANAAGGTGNTASTFVLDATASATDNLYNGLVLEVQQVGQGSRLVTAYNGTTKTATITPNWTTTPPNGAAYVLRSGSSGGSGGASAADVADAVWDEQRSGHVAAGSFGATSEWSGGSPPSAAAIADAVWDEVATDHATAGTMGENLQLLADAALIWPVPVGGGVTGQSLVDRAMAISDMHDNFVSPTEWLAWLNQEQRTLRLFLARSGWALPFDTTTATITAAGWSLVTDGAAAVPVSRSAAGHHVFTPTLADVMAVVCVHESQSGRLFRLSYKDSVNFLRQTIQGTVSQGHATDFRMRMYGNEIHMDFYPTPLATEIYLITYLSAPVPLTALTQAVALPMGWEERLVLGMARRAIIKEESDPSKIEQLLAEMDREIEELCWSRNMSEAPVVRNIDIDTQITIPNWQHWFWL